MRYHSVQKLDRTCKDCGQQLHYSSYGTSETVAGFDANFCPTCDVWLEPGCSDPDCLYCPPRPARPSEVGLPVKYYP